MIRVWFIALAFILVIVINNDRRHLQFLFSFSAFGLGAYFGDNTYILLGLFWMLVIGLLV